MMKNNNLRMTLWVTLLLPCLLNAQDTKLEVEDGSVLFKGENGSTPAAGEGVRLMWVPAKAAFRAGEVDQDQWDDINIGSTSFVGGGLRNTASGARSFVGGGGGNTASSANAFIAGGSSNEASSQNSFIGGGSENMVSGTRAFIGGGQFNIASNTESFVGGGSFNHASGFLSFVGGGAGNASLESSAFIGGGQSNKASGSMSFVGGGFRNTASGTRTFIGGGQNLLAKSFAETVFGTFNTDYTPLATSSMNTNDRLFVIGNGTDTLARSNAVTVMKNGRVGIGNAASNPDYLLDVAGSLNLNKSIVSGRALRVNDDEALWYDGTYFSWGFGADYNYFARPVTIGATAVPGFTLVVSGTAAKTDGGSWAMISDIRLKNVVGSYQKGVDAIIALRPVRFHYQKDNLYQLDSDTEQIGFVAQEVQPLFPEAVHQQDDGYLSLNMHPIQVALVNAVKELKEENDNLQAKIKVLEKDNTGLQGKVSKLEVSDQKLTSRLENLEKLLYALSQD